MIFAAMKYFAFTSELIFSNSGITFNSPSQYNLTGYHRDFYLRKYIVFLKFHLMQGIRLLSLFAELKTKDKSSIRAKLGLLTSKKQPLMKELFDYFEKKYNSIDFEKPPTKQVLTEELKRMVSNKSKRGHLLTELTKIIEYHLWNILYTIDAYHHARSLDVLYYLRDY